MCYFYRETRSWESLVHEKDHIFSILPPIVCFSINISEAFGKPEYQTAENLTYSSYV